MVKGLASLVKALASLLERVPTPPPTVLPLAFRFTARFGDFFGPMTTTARSHYVSPNTQGLQLNIRRPASALAVPRSARETTSAMSYRNPTNVSLSLIHI